MWKSHHPPTQVVKLSSPLGPPWGIPRSLLGQWRYSDLQKQHPNQFNLDGAVRWDGGVSRMCDTLQYTNGLHSFQPPELFFLSSSRMRRFGSQLGGTDFLPLRLPLCGLHHLSGSRFPRHPSTSRLKAWALLSRANLYLQGIRL